LVNFLPYGPPVSSICLSLFAGASLPFDCDCDFFTTFDFAAAGDAYSTFLAPPLLSTEAYA